MAGSAGAQTTRCQGEIISDVSIVTHGPYEALGTRWWEAPLRFATDLHTTTQPSVIRRFLIVKEGRPCIELERAESERILRAQPFLADASIAVIPDTAGTVALLVETRDELTPVLGVSTSGARITALKLGEGNLLGSGTYLAGQWRDGTSRDTYAIQGVDHQFLGRHYVLAAAYARRDHDMADWTADGRPLTKEFARKRLARMICADPPSFGDDDAYRCAAAIRQAQADAVRAAVSRIAAALPQPPVWLIVSGAGAFLASAAGQHVLPRACVVSLADRLNRAASEAAPAHALAVLARERG